MEHEKRADEAEAQGADLERRSEELEREIADVRDDWDAKKIDASVAGAQPGNREEEEERAPGDDPHGPEVGRTDPKGAESA